MARHVYYRTGDTDAPEQIKDRNGDVVLQMCRNCGKAESQIHAWEECTPRDPITELTDAQRERLTMLAEEAGEIVQACTKILRHGYSSYHPDDPKKTSNQRLLQDEMMEFWAIYERMAYYGDLMPLNFVNLGDIWKKKLQYTHHQPERLPVNHPPSPPEPPKDRSNAWKAGWHDYYRHVARGNCGFPLARPDLHKEWIEGWDAAKDRYEGNGIPA